MMFTLKKVENANIQNYFIYGVLLFSSFLQKMQSFIYLYM